MEEDFNIIDYFQGYIIRKFGLYKIGHEYNSYMKHKFKSGKFLNVQFKGEG